MNPSNSEGKMSRELEVETLNAIRRLVEASITIDDGELMQCNDVLDLAIHRALTQQEEEIEEMQNKTFQKLSSDLEVELWKAMEIAKWVKSRKPFEREKVKGWLRADQDTFLKYQRGEISLGKLLDCILDQLAELW